VWTLPFYEHTVRGQREGPIKPVPDCLRSVLPFSTMGFQTYWVGENELCDHTSIRLVQLLAPPAPSGHSWIQTSVTPCSPPFVGCTFPRPGPPGPFPTSLLPAPPIRFFFFPPQPLGNDYLLLKHCRFSTNDLVRFFPPPRSFPLS